MALTVRRSLPNEREALPGKGCTVMMLSLHAIAEHVRQYIDEAVYLARGNNERWGGPGGAGRGAGGGGAAGGAGGGRGRAGGGRRGGRGGRPPASAAGDGGRARPRATT